MNKIEFSDALSAISAAFPRQRAHVQRVLAAWLCDEVTLGREPAASIANLKAKHAKNAADERQLREALRARYGKYRITATDQVHIYGVMPNTNRVGWWLLGDKDELIKSGELC